MFGGGGRSGHRLLFHPFEAAPAFFARRFRFETAQQRDQAAEILVAGGLAAAQNGLDTPRFKASSAQACSDAIRASAAWKAGLNKGQAGLGVNRGESGGSRVADQAGDAARPQAGQFDQGRLEQSGLAAEQAAERETGGQLAGNAKIGRRAPRFRRKRRRRRRQ